MTVPVWQGGRDSTSDFAFQAAFSKYLSTGWAAREFQPLGNWRMTLAVSIFEGQRGKTGKRKSIDMGPTHEYR